MVHWTAHTLQELVSFLGDQHQGEKRIVCAVSERLRVTPQSVSAVFRKDDASLAWVEKVAAAYGHELQLSFPEMPMKGSVMQRRVAAMDYPNAGKLAGMLECVRMDNITINALAIKMKVSPHTVIRAFETGDIKISILKRMASVLGIDIQWVWIPTNPANLSNKVLSQEKTQESVPISFH